MEYYFHNCASRRQISNSIKAVFCMFALNVTRDIVCDLQLTGSFKLTKCRCSWLEARQSISGIRFVEGSFRTMGYVLYEMVYLSVIACN